MELTQTERARLFDDARRVLERNRQRGISHWENRAYDFVCPSTVTYPFQWLWDSCFHAIVLTHFDMARAQQELLCLLQAQQPDGFIPHMILWEREKYRAQIATYNIALLTDYLTAITQPPFLAQAVERVDRANHDAAFLAAVLPKTKAYYRWLAQNRDPDDDGLIAIIQPDEAGLDALPAYDALLQMRAINPTGLREAMERIFAAYAPLRASPAQIFAADVFIVEDLLMNCAYAQGCRALARLCARADDAAGAAEFERAAERVERALVEKCYDDARGIFFDLLGAGEGKSGVVTATSLLPLILEHLDATICHRLVQEHLLNAQEFWLPFPIPSVAANEPSFDPAAQTQLLWRGPTWVNLNWLIAGGLRAHGYGDLAHELTARTGVMIARGGYREYFDPLNGAGYGAADFGWSTLIVDMLAE